ncbi:MAG: argininosuccinate lyase, partial [Anaerolineae bacterium]|nr:argininosuccinate lyase [Anaerolineae bacterium]
YTHLQQAQPVLFSHWLMSYVWRFQRDRERLASLRTRVTVLPLGAGALAGNPFDLDREALSRDLGFARTSQNSIDAVGDRDYVVEFMSWAALLQTHLSSLAEELVLWSTREFGFVELDERYSTGSSLMPQKKNPDSLELVRGKSGRIIGHLAGMLATLKGLPTAYNKDLQEDKEALFDTIDTLLLELPLVAGVIQSLTIKGERMRDTMDSSMLATDLADYLVRRGVPFRESHHLAGQAVLRAEELGIPLESLSLDEFQAIHPAFDPDVGDVFDFQHSIECRSTEGGTATVAVRVQIASARAALETHNPNEEWRK